MALKDVADKIKKRFSKDEEPEDITFPKALKSGRHYKSTYGSSVGGPSQEYPIRKKGEPDLLDIEYSKKHGYPSTSKGELIGAAGEVIEDVNDDVKRNIQFAQDMEKARGLKKGGAVKSKAKPKASSASKRADGIATKGKTRGRII